MIIGRMVLQRISLVSAVVATVFCAFVMTMQPVVAAGILPDPHGKCPEDYAAGQGTKTAIESGCSSGPRDYELNDVKLLLGNIGNWMLGITGTVALFVFTFGGFMWLTSAGNSEMVAKGKGMIIAGIMGLIIIFFSYTLIVYGVRILAGDGADEFVPKAKPPKDMSPGATQFTVVKYPTDVPKKEVCVAKLNGVCTAKGKCASGTAIVGACGNTDDCCVKTVSGNQKQLCGQIGGTCQSNKKVCGGPYVKNLCLEDGANQDSGTQCCLDLSK